MSKITLKWFIVACYEEDHIQKKKNHIVPVARLEAFCALIFSRLESFRALNPYDKLEQVLKLGSGWVVLIFD